MWPLLALAAVIAGRAAGLELSDADRRWAAAFREHLKKEYGAAGERMDDARREAEEACGFRIQVEVLDSRINADIFRIGFYSTRRFCSTFPAASLEAVIFRIVFGRPRGYHVSGVSGPQASRPDYFTINLPAALGSVSYIPPDHFAAPPFRSLGDEVEHVLTHEFGHLVTTHDFRPWLSKWKFSRRLNPQSPLDELHASGAVSRYAAENEREGAAEMFAMAWRHPFRLKALRESHPLVEENFQLLKRSAATAGVVLPEP